MGPDDLADLNPPPEVVALGRPEKLFRQPTWSAKDARLSLYLFGLPSALIGLLLLSLPLGVLFIKEADRAKIVPITLLFLPLLSLFFFATASFFYARAANASHLSAYALYPTALAIWNEGVWSVVAWEEISEVLPHDLFRWYPALRFHDGRIQVLRYKIENPWLLSVAVQRSHRQALGLPDDDWLLRLVRNAQAGVLIFLAAIKAQGVPVLAKWERPELRPRIRRAFGTFLVLVGLGLTAYSWRWMANAFTGPVPITRNQLLEVGDVADLPNPFVTVPADAVLETDVVRSQTIGRRGTYLLQLYLVQVGDRWLVAEMPPKHKEKTFSGTLSMWSLPDPTQDNLLEEARKRVPPGAEILPILMDGAYPYKVQATGMAVVYGLILLAGGFFLLRAGPRSESKGL
jgi:hypothetical protein